jgi:hypothetical protein
VASLTSVIAFLFQFNSIEYLPISIGIFGSIVGALISYSYAKMRIVLRAPSVFISYTKKDSEFAHKIAEQMERFPVKVLIDTKEFKVGDKISDRIENLVEQCDYFAFVVSDSSLESRWANEELKEALAKKKKVLPLVLQPTSLPDALRNVVYADFSQSFEDGLVKLRRTFKDMRHNNKINQTAGSSGL